MMKHNKRYTPIFVLLLNLFLACSSGGGGAQTSTSVNASEDAVQIFLPQKLLIVDEHLLSGLMDVYDHSQNLIQRIDLTIKNGKATSSELTLSANHTYYFVLTFYYTVDESSEKTPIAYAYFQKAITKTDTNISYDASQILYDNPEGVNNDLSASLSFNGVVVPNLDRDGDGISNFDEIFENASAFGINNTPVFIRHDTVSVGQDPFSDSGIGFRWEIQDGDGDELSEIIQIYKGYSCAEENLIIEEAAQNSSYSTSNLKDLGQYSYRVKFSDGVSGEQISSCFDLLTGSDGILGWWKFNDYNPWGVDDSLNSDNPLYSNVFLQKQSWNDQGLLFSNESQGLYSPYLTPADNIETDFSIEMLVKPISGNDLGSSLTLFESGDLSSQISLRYVVSEKVFRFQIAFEEYLFTIDSRKYEFDSLYHVTVTFDQDAREVRLYVNGRLEGYEKLDPERLEIFEYAASKIVFGYSEIYQGDFIFNGYIKEIILYSSSLSKALVQNHCVNSGVSCVDPEKIALRHPQPNVLLAPANIYFLWDPKDSATEYEFCYQEESDEADYVQFDSDERCPNREMLNGPYFVLEQPTYNTTYRWKVRACQTDGCVEAFADFQEFKTPFSLRAWWRFDGTGTDFGPNNLNVMSDHSSTTSPSFVSGGETCNGQILPDGTQGICFDGVDDYIDLTSYNSFFDFGGYNTSFSKFTIFVRGFSQTTQTKPIFSKWNEGDNIKQYHVALSSSEASIVIKGDIEKAIVYSNDYSRLSSLSYGYTGNNNSSTIRLYSNGLPKNTIEDPEELSRKSQANTFIGHDHNSNRYFKGFVDEIIVFNQTLYHEQSFMLHCASEAKLVDSYEDLPEECR